jgi:hypothetical protein
MEHRIRRMTDRGGTFLTLGVATPAQSSRRARNQTKDLWAIFLHNAQSDARQC